VDQMSLFDYAPKHIPLASRLRPKTLDAFVGQEHLLGKGKILRQLIEKDQVSSMIFWGPPGVGKTTLAGIIAARTNAEFINTVLCSCSFRNAQLNGALFSNCNLANADMRGASFHKCKFENCVLAGMKIEA